MFPVERTMTRWQGVVAGFDDTDRARCAVRWSGAEPTCVNGLPGSATLRSFAMCLAIAGGRARQVLSAPSWSACVISWVVRRRGLT